MLNLELEENNKVCLLNKKFEAFGKVILMEKDGATQYGILTYRNKKYFLDATKKMSKKLSSYLWDSVLIKGNLNLIDKSINVISINENKTDYVSADDSEDSFEAAGIGDIQQMFKTIHSGCYLQLEDCG